MISFVPTCTTSLVSARVKYGFRKCFMSSIASCHCGSTRTVNEFCLVSESFTHWVRVADSFMVLS